jgi:hypothetical protein
MPVPDQVQDDGSGIQNLLKHGFRPSLECRFREILTFYHIVRFHF